MLSEPEYKAGQNSIGIARMQYGNAVERLVRDDLLRNPDDTISPQLFKWVSGPNNPDFIGVGSAAGQTFDITTPGQIGAHLARPYGPGLQIMTYTRPQNFRVFP